MRQRRVVEVHPLPVDGGVATGDDLAALLVDACACAGVVLHDGDVVCVVSTVVSKTEGRVVPDAVGRAALARAEALRVIVDAPDLLVTQTAGGHVSAWGGVDASNVPAGALLLLPSDPDAAAAALRDELRGRLGVDVGVLVTDTTGRPWRLGQTDVAIGAAGVAVLREEPTDRDGRALTATLPADGDAIAAASDLVRGKADGVPFVLLRGLDVAGDGTAADLVRPAAQDHFRHATTQAVEHAVAGGADLPVGGAPAARIAALLRAEDGVERVDVEGDRLAIVAVDTTSLTTALRVATILAHGHGCVVSAVVADGPRARLTLASG